MLRGKALELCVGNCPEQRLHFREFPTKLGDRHDADVVGAATLTEGTAADGAAVRALRTLGVHLLITNARRVFALCRAVCW